VAQLKHVHRFQSGAAKKIAEDVLTKALDKEKYDAERSPELAKSISSDILARLKGALIVRCCLDLP
jgi:hypothetical protein